MNNPQNSDKQIDAPQERNLKNHAKFRRALGAIYPQEWEWLMQTRQEIMHEYMQIMRAVRTADQDQEIR